MNYKRLHVSKNLFNADTWYGAYKISDGIYQTNRNTWYSLVAKPFTNDDIGKTFCFAANVEPPSGNARFAAVINGVQINGQYTDNRCIVTFTVQTIDDKIIFDYGSGSTTITTVSNVMLNTGSTPLPYEPYSSEVWHDSHYIRVNGEWQVVASAHERSGGQWD